MKWFEVLLVALFLAAQIGCSSAKDKPSVLDAEDMGGTCENEHDEPGCPAGYSNVEFCEPEDENCFVVESCPTEYCLADEIDYDCLNSASYAECPLGSLLADCDESAPRCFLVEDRCNPALCEWPSEIGPDLFNFGGLPGCVDDSDCVLVPAGDICGCLDCDTAAVNASVESEYQAALVDSRATCSDTVACPDGLVCEVRRAQCNVDSGECEAVAVSSTIPASVVEQYVRAECAWDASCAVSEHATEADCVENLFDGSGVELRRCDRFDDARFQQCVTDLGEVCVGDHENYPEACRDYIDTSQCCSGLANVGDYDDELCSADMSCGTTRYSVRCPKDGSGQCQCFINDVPKETIAATDCYDDPLALIEACGGEF